MHARLYPASTGLHGKMALVDPDELYALPPEEFTAARDGLVRAAKAESASERVATLKSLRRPSVAAWLVNRLAREQGELLERLLTLGPALAQAQSSGDADDLRTLGRQRRELVEAVAGAAVTAVGRSISGAVRDEVAGTLEAALADPATAEAIRTGRLVRALSYAGFGEVDLSGAVAAGSPPAAGRPTSVPLTSTPARRKGGEGADRKAEEVAARARAALAAAEGAAHEAAGRLDDAVRTAERAERAATVAAGALEQAEVQLRQARETVTRAEQARGAANTRAEATRAGAESAREAVRAAQDGAGAARAQLDRLRRSP